jgi:dephospho-CoA kinase
MILAISGRIGSGKDTVGNIIQMLAVSNDPTVNWEIKKYAGKLKEIACILTGCTLEQLENQEFKKLQIGSDWGMTYRELLQKLGTEAMRNGLHENVWVNALYADYKGKISENHKFIDDGKTYPLELEYPNWIITDMRFPNEFDAVKSRNGITIRVNRTNRWNKPQDIEHASETALDNHEFDYVIDNNGSMSDLITKVREILTQNQII